MSKRAKNKDKYLTVFTFTILVILCAVVFKCYELVSRPAYTYEELEAVVHIAKPGETAWDIADRYCPCDMDKRLYLEMCAKENGMDGLMGDIYYGRSYVFLKLSEK